GHQDWRLHAPRHRRPALQGLDLEGTPARDPAAGHRISEHLDQDGQAAEAVSRTPGTDAPFPWSLTMSGDEKAPLPRLEREPCPRCGGAGKHSYSQKHGSTCFRCGGRRETLTGRGQKAAEFLEALRSVPASTLAIGQRIRIERIDAGKQWVT